MRNFASLLPAPALLPVGLALLVGGLAGCNSYEMFRVTGFEQATFSNDADILFVIDNSDSMQAEASDLALNFNAFIDKLTSSEGSETSRVTLSDAVDNYIRETSGDSLFIDYQIGITTTSVQPNDANNLQPGDEGTFVGDPFVIARGDPNARIEFQRNLLCGATCFSENDVPSNPDFVCDEAAPDAEGEITSEYLDCLCGAGAWTGHCGSGNEMGLEGGLLAMCRAAPTPPEECYGYDTPNGSGTSPTIFDESQVGTGAGFLRENANTILVIVTDEGDGSYRQATGDSDPEVYTDAFAEFDNPVRVAVIGPYYDGSDADCLDGAQPWAVERYQNVVGTTLGTYIGITSSPADGCVASDFSENLDQIGDLLANLQTLFPLQTVPDVATIDVYIDNVSITESPLLAGSVETNDAEWGDGWTYEASSNAVAFHGNAIPGYNADVRIYYRPIGGFPRELPTGF